VYEEIQRNPLNDQSDMKLSFLPESFQAMRDISSFYALLPAMGTTSCAWFVISLSIKELQE